MLAVAAPWIREGREVETSEVKAVTECEVGESVSGLAAMAVVLDITMAAANICC